MQGPWRHAQFTRFFRATLKPRHWDKRFASLARQFVARSGKLLFIADRSRIGVQDHEAALELTYIFRFIDGAFFIQPDMQYIIRPSGTGDIPNALVLGTQIGINF